MLTFPAVVTLDGLAGKAGAGYKADIPARLRMEVWVEGTGWTDLKVPRWAQIYSSPVQRTGGSTDMWGHTCAAADEPAGGGVTNAAAAAASAVAGDGAWTGLRWDLRVNWEWWLDWCLCQPKTWACVYLTVALGAAGRGRAGTAALAANYAMSAAIFAAILAAYALRRDALVYPNDGSLSAPLYAVRFVLYCFLAASLSWEGNFLIDSLFISQTALTGVILSARVAAYTASGATLPVLPMASAASLFVALGAASAGLQIARRRVGLWIRDRLLRSDARAYAAAWAAILAREEDVAALNRLRLLLQSHPSLAFGPPPRQLRPADPPPLAMAAAAAGPCSAARRAAAAVVGALSELQPWRRGALVPVSSVEWLYKQAALTAPLLRAKAGALASAAQISPSARGLKMAVPADRARCSELKPRARTAEKLIRSYGFDPSRLLDCCR